MPERGLDVQPPRELVGVDPLVEHGGREVGEVLHPGRRARGVRLHDGAGLLGDARLWSAAHVVEACEPAHVQSRYRAYHLELLRGHGIDHEVNGHDPDLLRAAEPRVESGGVARAVVLRGVRWLGVAEPELDEVAEVDCGGSLQLGEGFVEVGSAAE